MSKTIHNHGIGFFGLLAIIFITLKLCNVITWSWWLVLMPIWIWWAIFLIVFVVTIIVFVIMEVCK
jgi:hypothetical protein